MVADSYPLATLVEQSVPLISVARANKNDNFMTMALRWLINLCIYITTQALCVDNIRHSIALNMKELKRLLIANNNYYHNNININIIVRYMSSQSILQASRH